MRKKSPAYIIMSSYGNDSVAMIQHLYELGLSKNSVIVYNDTGWAHHNWARRVSRLEKWARGLGFSTHRTKSEGFVNLVRRKRVFPRQGIQFCTDELKIKPTLIYLAEVDPEVAAMCVVGKRRAESFNRRNIPEFTEGLEIHGGRRSWSPLYLHSDEERNALLTRAGVKPLPHRSLECFPCVNANRADIRQLATVPERVEFIDQLELELATLVVGAKYDRTPMFIPTKKMGARGIKQVVRWGLSERGKFDLDDGTGDSYASGCDGGYCAS